MSFDSFRKKLEDRNSKEHGCLLAHVKGLVDISRNEMSKHYSAWDDHDAVFRSERKVDKEDRNADAKGQPKKLTIPLTQAQVMTFVSFCVMNLTQNKRFFELEPTGTEDNPLREPMELIVERDLRRNQWNAFLVQFFLDIGRFSLGVAEICYKEEYRMMRLPGEKEVLGAFGEVSKEPTLEYQRIPTFVGNRVLPVSPYRVLPDTRLPLTRYQEGEFFGSEDMFGMSTLRGDGNLFNLDKIPKMTEDEFKQRRSHSRIDVMETRANNSTLGATSGGEGNGGYVKTGPVVVTKMVCDIVPKHFLQDEEDCEKLGEEEFPVRFIVWLANDKTVIRFEEATYLHGQFPYMLAQFLPDQHKAVNEGLAHLCDQITNLITWLVNAHVTSQRNTLESKWIVDPAGIDIKSLESRSPYIFLKKNASQTGIDRYIKQFQTQDPTVNVMADAAALQQLLEVVTGFSGNMQGQYSSGRRSATESRVVTQGASARGRTTLSAIWDTAFEPCGKQLIANNRQEMEFKTFARIVGEQNDPTKPALEELFALFKADAISIATSEDFFVFDGTLPSEKAFLAQSLQEILTVMMSNPEIAQVLGYDASVFKELFDQIYTLRGVTNARLPVPKQQALPPKVVAMQPAQPSVSNG